MQEMQVAAVGLDPRGVPLLLIQERGGARRVLPVSIGWPEAVNIEIELAGRRLPRPLTHQLIVQVVEGFGRVLDRVEVTALRGGIFYADLVLDRGVRISARVSDAIAIALHRNVPIQAADDVLQAAGTTELHARPEGDDPPNTRPRATGDFDAEVARFREELDRIDPDEFGPS